MLQSLFENIAKVTLTTSAVIAVLLLLFPFIHKNYTAKWRHIVWIVVAVRLLIPFSPSIPQTPIEISPTSQYIEIKMPIQEDYLPPTPSAMNQSVISDSQDSEVSRPITLYEVFSIVWALGAVLFILYHLIGYFLFTKSVMRFAKPVEEKCAIESWFKIREEMKIGHNIKLLICKKAQSPMMTGFFKPLLILPDLDYSGVELKIILRHELIHYKRRDIWYKLLLVCANAVHWFNPLVYFMRVISDRDIEMACDSELIQNSDCTFRKQYSETIMSVIHKGNDMRTVLSTYFYGGKKTMKKRIENIFDMGSKRKGIIALCAIIATVGIAGSLVAYGVGEGSKGVIDNIALLKSGNSHSLDASGNVIVSYDNGKQQVKAPLKLHPNGSNSESGMEEQQCGFYISKEKTAIVYGGFSGDPVRILISDDMGKSWDTYTITDKLRGSSKFISFLTERDGWLVLSSFRGMGNEDHYIYKTSDGGQTWTEVTGNSNSVYARALTGMGFSEENIGFLCYRFEFEEFEPAICRTMDGGRTWEKFHVALPDDYDEYVLTPLSPVFTDANGLFPIQLSKDGAGDVIGTVYLKSDDYGRTWTFDEKYNMASVWADAWKTRDGRLRYAFMSEGMKVDFRKRQAEISGNPDNFAIRWSSPWVEDYDIVFEREEAVITYWYTDSTTSTYKGAERLVFGVENGRTVITDCITEIEIEEYVDTSDWKSIDTGTYTFSIPQQWEATAFSDGSISFISASDGVRLGTLSVLGYDSLRPLTQFEGNHAKTLSTQAIEGCEYPATKVVIRRTQPAAAHDYSYVDERHYYLIPENSRYAFDLCFTSPFDNAKEIEVARSVAIDINRVQVQTLARAWAEAVKDRDGKAQYNLMSSKLQKRSYNYYRNCNWVTGVSSPWIDRFTVKPGDTTATVTYTYYTSSGFAGYYRQTLSITKENGHLAISGYTEPEQANGRGDGTVIAYLEERNTWLSASSLKDGMFTDIVLSIDGKTKRFPWKTYGEQAFLPKLSFSDVDGDGKNELAVILCKGEGTGALVEEIHIINPEDFSEITVQSPLAALEKRVVSKIIDQDGVVITIDDKNNFIFPEKEIAARVAEKKNWFANLAIGSIVNYSVKNNAIVANVAVQISPAGFLGGYNLTYEYRDNQLKVGGIGFSSDI